jgi:hypothetical protein
MRDVSLSNDIKARYDEVLCSVDGQLVGQVTYLDPNCKKWDSAYVVPNDICMVCPTNAPLNSHMPDMDELPKIFSFSGSGCTGAQASTVFASNTSCVISLQQPAAAQQTFTCDQNGVGTLTTYDHQNGVCNGSPVSVVQRASGVCDATSSKMFFCPQKVQPPQDDLNGQNSAFDIQASAALAMASIAGWLAY